MSLERIRQSNDASVVDFGLYKGRLVQSMFHTHTELSGSVKSRQENKFISVNATPGLSQSTTERHLLGALCPRQHNASLSAIRQPLVNMGDVVFTSVIHGAVELEVIGLVAHSVVDLCQLLLGRIKAEVNAAEVALVTAK